MRFPDSDAVRSRKIRFVKLPRRNCPKLTHHGTREGYGRLFVQARGSRRCSIAPSPDATRRQLFTLARPPQPEG